MPTLEYVRTVARTPTSSDVFAAIAEPHRRDLLDALLPGEKTVGNLVHDLELSQPQVSKHLRVLSDAGLVRCRAAGRFRFYRLDPTRLQPFREWLTHHERAMNDRLDRVDVLLKRLQDQGAQP